MKRGLKCVIVNRSSQARAGEEASPMKRGLKSKDMGRHDALDFAVAETSPMKRGLK
jgi:hypothetical protein